MYCKGADTMILERLREDTSDLLKEATMQHLDKFAGDGLRTLCCAYKEIDAEYCVQWMVSICFSSLYCFRTGENKLNSMSKTRKPSFLNFTKKWRRT